MKTLHILLLTALAATIAAAAPFQSKAVQVDAAPGGPLNTMPHGSYECALPGDASGKAYRVVEEENFEIGTASSYQNAQGRGTYILRGNILTFTRGPKKGETLTRVGDNQLKRDNLLCTRFGPAR